LLAFILSSSFCSNVLLISSPDTKAKQMVVSRPLK
jgi:hypothetical protein